MGYLKMTDAELMELALKEAAAAALAGEVPVGAVLAKDGEPVIASGNMKERSGLSTRHAELAVIEEGMKLFGKYLYDCTLYVTLEPCAMCAGAIINARVGRVVFGASDPKAGCAGSLYNLLEDNRFNHRPIVSGGAEKEKCGEILSAFFKEKRGRK